MILNFRLLMRVLRSCEDEDRFRSNLLKSIEQIAVSIREKNENEKENERSTTADLNRVELMDLRINEYNAVKAEQRARLDAANKLISYHAVALATALSVIFTLVNKSLVPLPTVWNFLLWLPILSVPFAYAQYNEELMVRRMGIYIGRLKQQISGMSADERYWMWDATHARSTSWVLWISGFFRGGMTLLFATIGMIIGVFYSRPLRVDQYLLVGTDVILILLGAWIALELWRGDLMS